MPHALPPDNLLANRYKIVRQLGQGGFGITYLAEDVKLKIKVCLKELFISGNCTRGYNQIVNWSQDEAYHKKRFLEEAQQLAQLNHTNIVRVVNIFEETNTVYMLMEYVEGETIRAFVARVGTPDQNVVLPIMKQLLEAVEKVHQKGMLHRDIKPDNVLITNEKRVVLIDFGASRAFSEGQTKTLTAMLTHGYAPLEQYSERAQRGAHTDIYSLGATLYYILTRQKPIAATDRSFEQLRPPREVNNNIKIEISSAVMKAMAMQPKDRFQNVNEFRKALSINHDLSVPQPKLYQSVKIGNQEWMVANLNVGTFRNGDIIPEAKTDEQWERARENGKAAWCYYDNDPQKGATYGKLYNWYAVADPRGLAPQDWRIPTVANWTTLTNYLGEEHAGLQMKSTIGWDNDGNGNNRSGFAGLPGGNRSPNGAFSSLGKFGYWWSSSEDTTEGAWGRFLLYNDGGAYRNDYDKSCGFSVRCLRD